MVYRPPSASDVLAEKDRETYVPLRSGRPPARAARVAALAVAAVTVFAGCQDSSEKLPIATGSESPTPSPSTAPSAPPVVHPSPSPLPAASALVSRPRVAAKPAFTKPAKPPEKPRSAPGKPPAPGQQPRNKPTAGDITTHIAYACYPPGTAGYQTECDDGTEGYAHWGHEPYFDSKRRYVWIVDELPPGSRERAWLQFTVNAFNEMAKDDYPRFIYYTAEQLGSAWRGCSVNAAQVVEVCPLPHGERSYVKWTQRESTRHFITSSIHLALGVPAGFGDAWTESLVVHEFGHMIGFAHDTDCESVMTTCETFGTKYLWYRSQQTSAFVAIYHLHPTD